MLIVLATSNPGKLAELSALLAPLAIEVVPQTQFTAVPVEETEPTFVGNALLKARHAARHARLPAIADDSGLEVDALAGAPGVRSARFAGPGASDADNLRRLLAELDGIERDRRSARFRCVLVFLRSAQDDAPVVCEGSWEGRIAFAPRGRGGFGYDPVFEVPELGLTAAELDTALKNRLSHRGQALRALAGRLAAAAS